MSVAERAQRDRAKSEYSFHSYSSLAQSVERMTVNHDVAGSSPAGGAIWITPQFRTVSVRFEVFFYSINPYAIRLFATFILKIFLYLRLLIFDKSAAAFISRFLLNRILQVRILCYLKWCLSENLNWKMVLFVIQYMSNIKITLRYAT